MTFFDQWRSYKQEVIPSKTTMIEREECRRAFYAGGLAVLALLSEQVDEPSFVQTISDEIIGVIRDLRE